MKDDLENHSKCQEYLVGALVEYHPNSPRDPAIIHPSGKKVLPGIFLGYELFAGGIWNGDSDSRSGRLGKVGCIRHFSSKNRLGWNIDHTKMMNSYSHLQNVQQNSQEVRGRVTATECASTLKIIVGRRCTCLSS